MPAKKNTKSYKVRIDGLSTPSGTVPISILANLAQALQQASERALRINIEGISSKQGKTPSWLKESTDFVVTGLKKGSTILDIETATLGETAPEIIAQQDLWVKVPGKNDTALSSLRKSFLDATSEKYNGDYYDNGVLDAFTKLWQPIASKKAVLEISSSSAKDRILINQKKIDLIKERKKEQRPMQAVIVSGLFNTIEHSEGGFELKTKNGKRIRGHVDNKLISPGSMKEFWGSKVTIKGMATLKSSGAIRYLQAESLRVYKDSDAVFERIAEQKQLFSIKSKSSGPPRKTSKLKDIWGKWPGEESVEELLAMLTK